MRKFWTFVATALVAGDDVPNSVEIGVTEPSSHYAIFFSSAIAASRALRSFGISR